MPQNESEKKLYMPNNESALSFFIDENLPKNLWKALRAAGYTAARAVDEGLRGKHDSAIFRQVSHRSVIITRDQDFLKADLFPPPHSGIIVVKMPQDTPISELVRVVLNALDGLSKQELSNRVYVLERYRISHYVS
jgi:predicted nuclease of predicted toxin-antitoxin system